jgi:DNA-binding response OmpR family regulator
LDDLVGSRQQGLRDRESEGFGSFEIDDGEAALGMLKTTDVDLVVLDHHLPGMDGLDVLAGV